jgi:hypothetical protein
MWLFYIVKSATSRMPIPPSESKEEEEEIKNGEED